MSAHVRLKRAVRAAIGACGGIEGAAATVEKSISHAGKWNNLNADDLPTLSDALALDEIAVAQNRRAEILHRFAAELGHVAIRLPDAGLGTDAVTGAMIEASAEFGDIASALRDATTDGRIDGAEPFKIVEQIDEAMASLARMRALLSPPKSVAAAKEQERPETAKRSVN